MDFFGAQDDARRKTWRLALLFGAAVLSLVVLTNLLVALVYGWAANHTRPAAFDPVAMVAALPAEYWAWISLGVVGVVAMASGYKYLMMRRGGRAVAEALGGRLIPPSTTDFRERRLLNVVEEMAIASGMPVPPVYVVEEPSINAFAAGHSPDDAVIGVNRGTLEHLNRDELQGVIGHELSHVLNGDSRLNLRLIAVLHGILFIGVLGRGLLYGVGRGSRRRSGSSGGAPALALGLGLLVIGYAGTFFGNLIKAAVSRQREYLADAAAVQFTRNPAGIAGALKKIGGLGSGSRMRTAAAGEMSHIFFGAAGRMTLGGLLATHPPLEKRIRAVDPHWNGEFVVPAATPEPAAASEAAPEAAHAAPEGVAFAAAPLPSGTDGASALEVHATPEALAATVGRLDDRGLAEATRLIAGLPAAVHDAAHDPFSARALMYALVLDDSEDSRKSQLEHLARHAEAGLPETLKRLLPAAASLDEQQRLTLVEMAGPALKQLSSRQYRTFMDNLAALITADQRIELMEWVLHRLLVKELAPHFGAPKIRRGASGHGPDPDCVRVLLSALAREGGRTPDEAEAAFRAGMAHMGLEGEFDPRPDPDFRRLNDALRALRKTAPLKKPRLIKACAAAVTADGRVSVREGALLQGIAAALDCPLPPAIYRA